MKKEEFISFRKSLGKSREEFRKILGIGKSKIASIEQGKTPVPKSSETIIVLKKIIIEYESGPLGNLIKAQKAYIDHGNKDFKGRLLIMEGEIKFIKRSLTKLVEAKLLGDNEKEVYKDRSSKNKAG